MAQPLVETPLHFSGAGWTAQVHVNHVVVQTDPLRDSLPDAIHALLNPSERRHWTVVPLGEDDDGWDVWLLSRDVSVTSW